MQVFEKAKWIWLDKIGGENEYAEFFTQFDCDGAPALCRLSCDGDYTLFVNGEYVASNQYGDFEHFKIYDEIDISAYLRKGKNSVAILVWHFGQSTQRYILAQAGLIFEIIQNGVACVNSGVETLCRKSKTYDSTCKKTISLQLGFSFAYDATKEDEWMNTGNGFDEAVLVDKTCTFYPRPNQKLVLLPRVETEVLKSEGNYYLIDLKKETVGLPSLAFYSPCVQKIRVDFGEDLQDGHVRRLIGNRDFSFDYVAKEGENEYVNYMLRLGCRYLEVYAESPIEIRYVGIIPQVYPAVAKTVRLSDPIEQKIYDTCLETLKLCMMEHYVDCPWREQCLYAFDSRNQMLCGYYAFENGNAEYARSNLKLMSEDRREDKLLAITYPCGVDLTIPSFSLYYYMAVREYVEHTGDVAFAKEVYPKLASVLSAFMENRKDGLLCKFSGSNHWNFYDWSDYLDGNLLESEEPVPDLMANLLFIIALENLKKIDCFIGQEFIYEEELSSARKGVHEAFFHQDTGFYSMSIGGNEYTVLGNSLAILAGVATGEVATRICDALVNGGLSECSLSVKTFKYDALLAVDEEKWKEYVFAEIRKDYMKMIDAGATTVWETIDGAAAFENAGSLCHGWSSIPLYYYWKYKI